ncbi:hypothetical protein EK21DRAFT_89393 [Setomelanomma holmii]|uniref:Uncharacterized protein n=1 Tax=Setomelanomma holmii TaxID=210430 RepID=A0A9P4H824_9PLEO|nr:hypothetical protein EK21DRAFT_89393 [Setomelanomma holmii]
MTLIVVPENYRPPPATSTVECCTCMCDANPSLESNQFFDSHCLFQACTSVDGRKEFISSFIDGCVANNHRNIAIPAEWEPFAPTYLPRTTQTLSSTAISTLPPSLLVSSEGSTITSVLGSRNLVTNKTSPSTAMAISTSAKASSTNWADIQKPICGITEACLKNQTTNDPCKLTNLQCVCKYSNSVHNSKYFLQGCLFDECFNDLGRTDWMDSFAYACDTVNLPLIDVDGSWAKYVPKWYLAKNSTAPSSSLPSGPPATSSPGVRPPAKPEVLSEGTIAGISVGGFILLSLFAAAIMYFLRMRKKVNRKTKEAAQLADTHHPGGVQSRIDQLTYGRSSLESLGTTAVATSSSPAHRDPHDPYSPDPYGIYKPPFVGSPAHGDTYQSYKPSSSVNLNDPYRQASPRRLWDQYGQHGDEDQIHPAERSPTHPSPKYEHYATKPKYGDGEIHPVVRSPVYDEHGNKIGYQ